MSFWQDLLEGYRSNGQPPPTEDRTYTDSIVEAILAANTGESLSALRTAALEAAAGWWSRCFMMASVTPATASVFLTPSILGWIGRSLCQTGQAMLWISTRPDPPTLYPVQNATVTGGRSRDSWRYDLNLNGPEGSFGVRATAAYVLHVQYSFEATTPSIGVGPMQWASTLGRMSASMEQRLTEEAAAKVGYLIPIPKAPLSTITDAEGNAVDPLANLKRDLANLKGQTALVETSGGMAPEVRAPQGEWQPRRVGLDPPETVVRLRQQVFESVLSVCGVPPGLVSLSGGHIREHLRTFLHTTLAPAGRLLEAEASAKLSGSVRVSFERLYAADVQGRARAFASMTSGGLSVEDARRLAGLDE